MEPGIQHFGCLVDLLGRAEILEEAKKVVREMPMEQQSYVLGALLNACRVIEDVELGKETVEHLIQQSLDHGGEPMGWCGKVKKGNGKEKGTAASKMQLD